MAELDKDLLKKTAGLLAEIDRVASAPTVAERVARVIESAAPDRRYDTFDSFEAWEYQRTLYTIPYGPEMDGRLLAERHMPDQCGCPTVDAVFTEVDGKGRTHTRPVRVLECETAEPAREEPIRWTTAPYASAVEGLVHTADRPCAAEGCACHDLWAPEESLFEYTWFDETWAPDPAEVAAIRDYGEALHARMQAQFVFLGTPSSLLDITVVD